MRRKITLPSILLPYKAHREPRLILVRTRTRTLTSAMRMSHLHLPRIPVRPVPSDQVFRTLPFSAPVQFTAGAGDPLPSNTSTSHPRPPTRIQTRTRRLSGDTICIRTRTIPDRKPQMTLMMICHHRQRGHMKTLNRLCRARSSRRPPAPSLLRTRSLRAGIDLFLHSPASLPVRLHRCMPGRTKDLGKVCYQMTVKSLSVLD